MTYIIEIGCLLDDQSSIPDKGNSFYRSTASRPAADPNQTHIYCVLKEISSGIKGPGREADHSPSSNGFNNVILN
jgi:hypothetical protein